MLKVRFPLIREKYSGSVVDNMDDDGYAKSNRHKCLVHLCENLAKKYGVQILFYNYSTKPSGFTPETGISGVGGFLDYTNVCSNVYYFNKNTFDKLLAKYLLYSGFGTYTYTELYEIKSGEYKLVEIIQNASISYILRNNDGIVAMIIKNNLCISTDYFKRYKKASTDDVMAPILNWIDYIYQTPYIETDIDTSSAFGQLIDYGNFQEILNKLVSVDKSALNLEYCYTTYEELKSKIISEIKDENPEAESKFEYANDPKFDMDEIWHSEE